ncbi:aminotransferase class I/II-fold pyridoxal phosphate-dependent enzyme [Vibrio sp. ZSDE26]|uniref:Aminotransferase class I/II-fold pyridoxal phosphate-dependent enzyme n=1 Tax=Vibrio amylolyticus TaxID=2847292 RepID=A0A9X1XK80_9VIBR|nr:aminotransferase class I/II-fold pyridoxal phosphate-dependent enzyme [Vibrio amylolyticus]MCK6263966.1 aminotransferase class I/II-fold pyridoxal phosphate-dependent enzyme [Vibrio amylolyticus]
MESLSKHLSCTPDCEQLDTNDVDAKKNNLYGLDIIQCKNSRQIKIKLADGPKWVIDYLTNSPFSLHVHPQVIKGSVGAIQSFGAIHASVANARAVTGVNTEITRRLSRMKTGDAQSRLYPTTLSANIAVAGGLASELVDSTAVVHTNVHSTVQFAVSGAFDPRRVIRTKNTVEVASSFAKTTKRPVVIIEDGLYSMGNFADFEGIGRFLDENPNGWAWFDDAHSVGMHGLNGRGAAMEMMERYADRTIVTGSLGKAFGAAGGFMAASKYFTQNMLAVSVSDRFSCNLDVSAQGAALTAMKLIEDPSEYKRLQSALTARLERIDAKLCEKGIMTEQHGTPIAYRVIPFSGPQKAIQVAAQLLNVHGLLTTPVYYPTIARGKGAIRVSLSVEHRMSDIDALVSTLAEFLTPNLVTNHSYSDPSKLRVI